MLFMLFSIISAGLFQMVTISMISSFVLKQSFSRPTLIQRQRFFTLEHQYGELRLYYVFLLNSQTIFNYFIRFPIFENRHKQHSLLVKVTTQQTGKLVPGHQQHLAISLELSTHDIDDIICIVNSIAVQEGLYQRLAICGPRIRVLSLGRRLNGSYVD